MKKNTIAAFFVFTVALGVLLFYTYSNVITKENIAASLEKLKEENQTRRQNLIELMVTHSSTEQLGKANISRILNHNHDQAGVSSESILVSSAGVIISVSRYGTDTTGHKVRDSYLKTAIAGESGDIIATDYRGIPSLIVYSPVEIKKETFALLSLMDLTEAEACAGGCEN